MKDLLQHCCIRLRYIQLGVPNKLECKATVATGHTNITSCVQGVRDAIF